MHEILQISNNFEVISMTNLNKKHNDPNNDSGGTKPNKSITNPYWKENRKEKGNFNWTGGEVQLKSINYS